MKHQCTKTLAGLMAMLFCLMALSGCGTGGSEQSGSDTTADTGTETTLTEVKNSMLRPGMFYQNPLTDSAADPMIIEHDGTYYLYSTGNKTLSVRTSKNLLSWTSQSEPIFSVTDTTWAVKYLWAPEVHEYNGKFYLFYCAKDKDDIFHVDIAVCDTPNGKFKPLQDKPLLAPDYSVIDVSFFEDDDGRTYLFYSKDCSTNKIDGKRVSQSYGIEVSNDLMTLIGEPVLCATPTYKWELKSGNTLWNEGPVVFKRDGRYYLLYSANYYQSEHYSVGYAVSDTVLGLYEKPEDSRILYGNGETITGSGHCTLLYIGDEIYLTYHSHTVPPNTDGGRSLYIDQLMFEEDGTPYVNGPTNTKMPLPDGINGTQKYDGEFELSAEMEKEQELSVLCDGNISHSLIGVVEFKDGDTLTVSFDTPQRIDTMWVYSSYSSFTEPNTMDVTINGTYRIEDVKFSSLKGSPAVAVFSKLPEGTLISKLEISFTAAEESMEGTGITEIQFVNYVTD